MIEKQAIEQDFLVKRALEEALDQVFSEDNLHYVFVGMTLNEKLVRAEWVGDEDLIWETASERIEKSFDAHW